MIQDALFRSDDRDTSYAAARRAPSLTDEILAIFDVVPNGLTDDELAVMMSSRHAPTVKTARSRLTGAGLLVDSSVRRESQRGVAMIVWQHKRHWAAIVDVEVNRAVL